MDVESGTTHALRNFSDDNTSKRNKIIAGVTIGTLVLGGVAVGVYFGTQSSSSNNNTYSKGLTVNPTTRSGLTTTQTLTFGSNTGAAAPPAKVNWANFPYAVSPVKDQGQCGSCWAFATTEAVESAFGMVTGQTIVPLSPQQLTACDTGNGDQGCNGGDPAQALQGYLQNYGLTTEAKYPYASSSGNSPACNTALEPKNQQSATDSGIDVLKGSASVTQVATTEAALKSALLKGPVQVSIDATNWSNYNGKGQVVDGTTATIECSSNSANIDHAVQLVGYDTTAAIPYWIVKNQWGTSWGNAGYIYLKMAAAGQADLNTCCITCAALQADVNAVAGTPASVAPTMTPITVSPTLKPSRPVVTPTGTSTVTTTSTPTTTSAPAGTTKAPKSTSNPTTSATQPAGPSTTPSGNFQPCNSQTITVATTACYATAAQLTSSDITTNFYCQSKADTQGFYYCCFVGNGWGGSISLQSSTSNGATKTATCTYTPSGPILPSSSSSSSGSSGGSSSSGGGSSSGQITNPSCCSYDSSGVAYWCWFQGYCTDVYGDANNGYYDPAGTECSNPGSGFTAAANAYGSGC